MIVKPVMLRRKLRGLFLKLFNYIENNGNCNFDTNGENKFIEHIFIEFNKESKKKIIFDIGANIGEYTQMMNKKSIEMNVDICFYLFEPTKKCFNKISEKFTDNEKFTLNNFGVSNINDTAKIYYDKEESGLASLYQRNLDSYNIKLSHSEEIKLRRIDEYIKQEELQHIDFVKIDIEGHELKAFDGFGEYLNSDFIDYIQFEYGGANLDSHTSLMEIYDFLTKKGFVIAKVMKNGLEIRDYKPYMDNFSYANYVAISKNKII